VTGLTASALAASMRCHGEGLICNIDDAIGAYSVLIWTLLGALIFGIVLLIACNRVALLGGMILLLAPIVVVFTLGMIGSWSTGGVDAYGALRKLLVMVVPPCVTVLIQALVLRAQLLSHDELAVASESSAP